MIWRRLLFAVLLIPAIISGYLTWLLWRAGDSGKWFFGVFTVFFLLLVATPILPKLRSKPPPEPSPNTRFVPHWYMMGAALVLLGCIIFGLIAAIRAILQ
jgi:protein-S-isoprenylcysteine O-methyltransferase Ste14